jgi:hypothetical protein
MSFFQAKVLAIFTAPLAVAAFTGCLDTSRAAGTPVGASGSYEERVGEISDPVLALGASVSDGMEAAVSLIGDASAPPEHAGLLLNLNRDAQKLSNEAQTAVFRLSVLGPPDNCLDFHRKHSEALQLFGQMGFEYALATSPDEGSPNRINLDFLERGDRYRGDAEAALIEVEALKEECGA